MDMGKQCTDSNLELQVFKDIAATALQGKELELSLESKKHLEECEKCQECTPLYIANAKAAFEDRKYDAVIEEAEKESQILKKNVKQGLALFKPGAEGRAGILVIVENARNVPHSILQMPRRRSS